MALGTGSRGLSGTPKHIVGRILRLVVSVAVAVTVLVPPATLVANAAQGDRSLHIYHTHTRESARITYKRNGRWDEKGLRQLNLILADWRTKEPTKMDPALFDLLWSVYRDVGATQPIHIVSSYRSPKTNKMLASKSSGVADNSLHMKGKAIDFFIPGVDLGRLRESVMRHQVGGIGYYPTSGSPFVHADTGNVRAWPRLTRAQLKKVFPDGRTLHLPTDGKPLSTEGRRYAEAEWKKCRTVPCSGSPLTGGPAPTTMLASLDIEAPVPLMRPRSLSGAAPMQVAALGGDPEQRIVPTIDVRAPLPMRRDLAADGAAPIPARKSERLVVATLHRPTDGTALDALTAMEPLPPGDGLAATATAYAAAQEPQAQEALRMIIERETTASVPKSLPGSTQRQLGGQMVTASLGGPFPAGRKGVPDTGLASVLEGTFSALGGAAPEPIADALASLVKSRQANPSIAERPVELIPPEIAHVDETLVHPVSMSGDHFAVMSEAEGYLDKNTELGPLTGRIGFVPASAVQPAYDRFVVGAPLLVASR